jgi:hypothetical protein
VISSPLRWLRYRSWNPVLKGSLLSERSKIEPSLIAENMMSDDKTKTGSPDRDRVNVHEDYEVRYWTKKFGVSAEQLKAAVAAVGPTAKAVEAYFQGATRKP